MKGTYAMIDELINKLSNSNKIYIKQESNMSEQESQNKPITEILAQELAEYGYDKKNRISQSELLLFLNRKSPDGKFDPNLSEKLFQTLNLNKTSRRQLYSSIKDLDGKNIGVETGKTFVDTINKNFPNSKIAKSPRSAK